MVDHSQTEEDSGDDELFEFYNIKVDPGQSPIRIDKFLMERIEKAARNKIQNACKSHQILVNDQPIKQNYKVKPKDVIRIMLDRDPQLGKEIKGENIPLDIIEEDEHLLVINKPPGMVVHPGIGNYSGTLVNALVYHLQQSNLPILKGNSLDRPGLVHRIDKDTSGLLVVAKTEEAMNGLAKQFFDHSIDRTYVALVWGDLTPEEGTIRGNIARHPTNRMQMHVFPDDEEVGKRAITHYRVLESLYYVTLVECKLETGRTHQIRVHMKHKGHTLFNDARYGGDRILKGTVFSKYKQFVDNCFEIMPRQALHAQSLGFIHPLTGDKKYFEQPIPDDFKAVLEKWRNYTESRQNLNLE
jgi:23S rRNA pseudouridine1911/1915/1917 synthase